MAQKIALTDGNYKWMAEQLKCEPEMIAAFSQVECKRPPFDADGFPAILYERHKFWKNADRSKRDEWHRLYPDIVGPSAYGPGGYGTYAGQRVKFSRAFQLDPDAAMEACSWGAFQELGENYADYGFPNVGAFVEAMKDGLRGQCKIFILSIKRRGLQDDLQNRAYTILARLYNGPRYADYHYDQQLKSEYEKAKARRVDWSKVVSVIPEGKLGLPTHAIVAKDVAEGSGVLPSEPQAVAQVTPTIADEAPQMTEGTPGSGTHVKVSGDNVEVQTGNDGIPPGPKEKVAIEKPESQGFMEGIWKRITGLFGGNVGLDAVTDKAQQVGALGLSPDTWTRIITLGLVASGLYLAFYTWHFFIDYRRNKQITEALVRENSTPDNFVQLVDKDQIEDYKARGYKVITR